MPINWYGIPNSYPKLIIFSMEMNIYTINIKATASDTMTIMGARDTKKSNM